jgi:hypothetical protein
VVWSIENSIITPFIFVSYGITTVAKLATVTALRWVNTVVSSIIALFETISDVITASWESAVWPARVGEEGIVGSVVALFKTESEVGFVVTTFPQADRRASVKVVSISVVALLSRINDTITACWQAAGGSANSRDVLVSCSEIACLAVINNTITTSGQFTVASAAVRLSTGERGVTVSLAVIALLCDSNSGGDWFKGSVDFHSSVPASAVGELREIIDQLFQELIGGGGSSRSLEKDRDNEGLSVSSSIVEQLQFKIESSATDQMLRWGVEDESL